MMYETLPLKTQGVNVPQQAENRQQELGAGYWTAPVPLATSVGH